MKKENWITCNKEWQSPIFRKKININGHPDAAKIKICGLGFFELYINGQKVSGDYFVPVWSDYQKRDLSNLLYPVNDEFTHRVYYVVYDVTKYLKSGSNIIDVMLGNGWYRQNKRNIEGNLWYDDKLKLAFRLEIECEGKKSVIKSGTDMLCREGYCIENNIFYGETHDYLRLNSEEWTASIKTTAPEAFFEKQDCPPDRVISSFKPKLLFDYGNKKIYDAGVNISGWARITAQGGTVTVRYSENIKNGLLDFESAYEKQIQTNKYLNTQVGTVMHPHFTWHAFRYFEIEGKTSDVTVDIVHADINIITNYRSQNKVHNWLFEAFIRTQLNNMHSGVPSDCPHRERLGYTGDGQLTCETAMITLNCKKFYKKWIQDILDCQDLTTGHVQHTAPFYGGGGGPGGWGGAIVIVPYNYYKYYRNKAFLAVCYSHMLKWLNSMHTFCDNGLIVREYPDGWCLGEWCTPEKIVIPEPFVNTYYYIKCMHYIEEIAAVLGQNISLKNEIEKSLAAVKENYYSECTQSFCGGVQGADAFGLDLGLGGENTFNNLVAKYSLNTGFDTGIFGTDVLCTVLFEKGRYDLVLRLLGLKQYPSFGYMMERGATTLWETWGGEMSHNHPMFGACVKYLFPERLKTKLGRS